MPDKGDEASPKRVGGSEEAYDVPQGLSCPVCQAFVQDLGVLNRHLDVSHGFQNKGEEAEGGGMGCGKANSKHGSGFSLERGHWEEFVAGKSRCGFCKRVVKHKQEMRNCRKCGRIQCVVHCKNLIRLNRRAEYDVKNGAWCKCCAECLASKAGYNDVGAFQDVSKRFFAARHAKSEDYQLRVIQLENRLVLLVDGIVQYEAAHRDALPSVLRGGRQISSVEKMVTPWKDNDSSNCCTICNRGFNLLLRRHHCRLCGALVCDNNLTSCSYQPSLGDIMKAAPDLPYKCTAEAASQARATLRVCRLCIHIVFAKRKFQQSVSMEASLLLQKYKEIQQVSFVILRIMPRFKTVLAELDAQKESPSETTITEVTRLRNKLLASFTLYEKLAKGLINLEPSTHAERAIQRAINAKTVAFIQEHMLPIKRVSEVLSSPPQNNSESPNKDLLFNNLTISEVKGYREQLMVLKEQKYIVQGLIEDATKQRKFEEIPTLQQNIEELQHQILETEKILGDQGFE